MMAATEWGCKLRTSAPVAESRPIFSQESRMPKFPNMLASAFAAMQLVLMAASSANAGLPSSVAAKASDTAGTPTYANGDYISFVSIHGDDANECYDPTTPCKTIKQAYYQTVSGGEIIIQDSSGYFDGIVIDKTISIHGNGSHLLLGMYIAAGASDKVELDGFYLHGRGGDDAIGITILSAGDIVIRNCHIDGYRATNGRSYAAITLTNTSGPVRVTIDGTALVENDNGIVIQSAPGMGHVKITNSQLTSNSIDGIKVTGAGNDVLLSNVQIIGSAKALDFLAGGGSAKSYGNNLVTNGDAPVKMPLN
jgi:hypothetical protein